MTIITKFSSGFTDTSLPILQKDPVLPPTGGVFLLDSKNLASWTGGATIGTSDPLNTLGKTAAADGTNPGQGYWSSLGSPTDLSTINEPLAFNPTTGRITFPSADQNSARFIESQATSNYLFNGTDNFCISIWVYAGTPSTTPKTLLITSAASTDSARRGLQMTLSAGTGGSGQGGFQVNRPTRTGYPIAPGNTAASNTSYFAYGGANNQPGAVSTGVHRVGYAWYKTGGNWFHKGIIDQVVGTEYATPNHQTTGIDLGQSTAGGARDPYYITALGNRQSSGTSMFGTDNGIYRIYIENLTLSGRTPEQVWAADWTRGNGRFS